MKILIMRHGQAGSYEGVDEARELIARGREDAKNAGQCLAQLITDGKMPAFDKVWVSPYVRTQQTADEVLASFPQLQRENKDILISHDQPQRVLDALSEENFNHILLISHNPLVNLLVAHLTDGKAHRHISMQPASMALIDTDELLAGCGQLQWLRHAPLFEAVI